MKITIVSVFYWPEKAGIAPYTTMMAEHLAGSGNDVEVVTALPSYPEWRVFSEYRRKVRSVEFVNGVTVRRFRQYVPRNQNAIGRGLYEFSFWAHGSSTRGTISDVVIAVIPGLSGGFIAARMARRWNAPLGILVQDLTGPAAEQSGIPLGRKLARGAKRLEGRLLRMADQVGVVSPAFERYLETLGVSKKQIRYLPNWSHGSAASRARQTVRVELGWDSSTQVVLHAGNMGYKQGLENLVNAARLSEKAGDQRLFVLMGDGNQRDRIAQLASGLSNINIVPPVWGQRFSDVLAAADVLVVNERGSVADMSLPSKLTAYFSAGLPVVACVRSDGATAMEVARSGGGLIVPADDPKALVETLEMLCGNALMSARLGAAGQSYAESHLSHTAAVKRIDSFVAALV